jgi:hypothetical protein
VFRIDLLQRQLAVHGRPYPFGGRAEIRMLFEQQSKGAAGIETNFESLILQRPEQAVDRARRRAGKPALSANGGG